MYTTEAQFRERGITVTFKKQAPYPLTETQSSAPLPTVLEVDGRRRYLSDIQLLERELQSLTASHRPRRKIPNTPNARPPVHPLIPLSRAASCGVPPKISFLDGLWTEIRESPAVLDSRCPSVPRSNALSVPFGSTMPLFADYSSTIESRQSRTGSRAGPRCQLASASTFPNTPAGDSWTKHPLLECLPLQISSWCDDNSVSVCNISAPSSSLRVREQDVSDKPEVELGTVVGLTLNNAEEDEAPAPIELDPVPAQSQSTASSTPASIPAEVDLHIGDLTASCSMSTGGSFMTVSRGKVALGKDTPSPRSITEFVSSPLVVQSYTLPEKSRSFSNSKSVTVIPGRNARILKDIESVDCGTMTADFNDTPTNEGGLLISTVGSELVTAVTEQKLASGTHHADAKVRSAYLIKQEMRFRMIQKQKKKYLADEDHASNAPQQSQSNEDVVASQVTEKYDASDAYARQDLTLMTDTVCSEPLSSRVSTDRSTRLQNKQTNATSEGKAEPTGEHSVNNPSDDTIEKNHTLTVPEEALTNDITIYRTEENGTVLEDDIYIKQQLLQKIDGEEIVCDDEDDTFLNSLNRMRRSYGLENAYNNFGAFLSNVSDFIRDHSISSATELPSSLSNDPLRRSSLSSTLQMSDNPLPRKRSQLRIERFAQLHKTGSKRLNVPNLSLSKEQMTEKIDALLPLLPQDPVQENTTCEGTALEREETHNYTAPLVAIEQAETPLLPQLRVAAFPSNPIKGVSISSEAHVTLPRVSEEKLAIPPLEFQTHLPAVASTGVSSPSYPGTSGRHKSCSQPPNTPHISHMPHPTHAPHEPEPMPISVLPSIDLNKSVHKPYVSSDTLSSICSSQLAEPGPFKSKLPGFGEGSKNDAAISSAFAALRLIGSTSKGCGGSFSRSSHAYSKSHHVSSSSQPSSDAHSLTEGLPVFSVATKRNTVDEAAVGHDPNKLILARSALEDLVNMSDSELSVLREGSILVSGAREDTLQFQCTDRRASESGQ